MPLSSWSGHGAGPSDRSRAARLSMASLLSAVLLAAVSACSSSGSSGGTKPTHSGSTAQHSQLDVAGAAAGLAKLQAGWNAASYPVGACPLGQERALAQAAGISSRYPTTEHFNRYLQGTRYVGCDFGTQTHNQVVFMAGGSEADLLTKFQGGGGTAPVFGAPTAVLGGTIKTWRGTDYSCVALWTATGAQLTIGLDDSIKSAACDKELTGAIPLIVTDLASAASSPGATVTQSTASTRPTSTSSG
jgi:hypothetical protein